jgi:hypothetical protein
VLSNAVEDLASQRLSLVASDALLRFLSRIACSASDFVSSSGCEPTVVLSIASLRRARMRSDRVAHP